MVKKFLLNKTTFFVIQFSSVDQYVSGLGPLQVLPCRSRLVKQKRRCSRDELVRVVDRSLIFSLVSVDSFCSSFTSDG